jgi:putative intracellular protease/amidase
VRAHKWANVSMNFQQGLAVEWDVVIVPGGVWSSTVVRNDADAINLVLQQYKSGRLLAAVCSGTTALVCLYLLLLLFFLSLLFNLYILYRSMLDWPRDVS